jgi:hypothetical protein
MEGSFIDRSMKSIVLYSTVDDCFFVLSAVLIARETLAMDFVLLYSSHHNMLNLINIYFSLDTLVLLLALNFSCCF